MVFLATRALSLVVGTRPSRLPNRVSRPFVKTLPQKFRTRPAEVDPFPLAAPLRYRSAPDVLLYLVRTPIAIALRTEGAQQACRHCRPSAGQRLENEKIGMGRYRVADLAVEGRDPLELRA